VKLKVDHSSPSRFILTYAPAEASGADRFSVTVCKPPRKDPRSTQYLENEQECTWEPSPRWCKKVQAEIKSAQLAEIQLNEERLRRGTVSRRRGTVSLKGATTRPGSERVPRSSGERMERLMKDAKGVVHRAMSGVAGGGGGGSGDAQCQ
jgi:hypothetical protein